MSQHIAITGANRGIGLVMAHAFADLGCTVHLLGRDLAALEQAQHAIGKNRSLVWPIDLACGEVQTYKDLAHGMNRYLQAHNTTLSGLLHNAGVLGEIKPVEHYDASTWQQVMNVNLRGALLLTQQLLPLLRQACSAHIAFTSSSVGRTGRANWGAYSVSKFAVEGLMQVLADELQDSTIKVCSIDPGATRTTMRQAARPEEDPNTVPPADSLIPIYAKAMGLSSSMDGVMDNVHGQCLVARQLLPKINKLA